MGSAIVTGAAGGIGRALAQQLAAAGHAVRLVDLRPTEDLATELGATPVVLDVADPDQWERLAAETTAVDWLCLNAGVVGSSFGPPWEASPQEWADLIDVNLLGVVNGLRVLVPPMVASARPGHVLITASLAGLVTFPGGGAYAATKHALVAVAEQTSLALAETDVTVTLLCPALVRSGMAEDGADPDVVAAEALAACRRGEFLVAPEEWTRAVTRRSENLLSGRPPTVPEATGTARGER